MSADEEQEIYVIDVCGTLVYDDTTLGLLKHHFANEDGWRRVRYWLFKAMTARLSPLRFAFLVAEKLTGRHVLKHIAIGLLSGDHVEALNLSAAEYAAHLLQYRRVASVWRLIDAPSKSGQIMLASASLEPVVASLAETLGARYVASALEHRDGVLTGRYASDLTGRKESALIEKYGCNILAGEICVISDNFSDRSLLEKATRPYVVLHSESHRQRWQGLNATFLEVSQ